MFMSDSVIAGVTVGAAFHVGSSQITTVLGLHDIPRYKGVFKLMKLWYSVGVNIHQSNVASVGVTLVCALIIYLVKRSVIIL